VSVQRVIESWDETSATAVIPQPQPAQVGSCFDDRQDVETLCNSPKS